MGNSQPNSSTASMKDFQMQKYMNQGLNQGQILQIKEAFESYQPVDGQIQLSKLRHTTQQSRSKGTIDKYLGNKTTMNFDEFFRMSKELLQDRIKQFPTMIIDTSQVEATCLFCPYAIDKKH